ncbi:L-ascorbate oxidase homolog [Linum grandiflorum]
MCLVSGAWVKAEDPYRYFTWEVTYGTVSPLNDPQRVSFLLQLSYTLYADRLAASYQSYDVFACKRLLRNEIPCSKKLLSFLTVWSLQVQAILINGQFPGPPIDAVTNDNILVNVVNKLDVPFLVTWNGIKQRRTSWQDGVLGTQCPIPPNSNWTYKFQVKDQIGTFNYFPSIGMQRAAGGFGAFNINQRSVISKPYPEPFEEFTVLVSDWYNTDFKQILEERLDQGTPLPLADGLLINGLPSGLLIMLNSYCASDKLYKFRISNVGISTAINFRIQGHSMTLIEVEGAHTLQEIYESLDVHVGQSVTVLVRLHAPVVKDYFIVASSRFTKPILTTTAILKYAGSTTPASNPLPIGPTYHLHWSMKQARTIRLNLTANAARPNPQGSFHYGTIQVMKTVFLTNSVANINGKLRYAINSISHVDPATPLKLADWFNVPGVFKLNSIPDKPTNTTPVLAPGVLAFELHDFVEIIFQNAEFAVQSWHMDGSSFYVAGYGNGPWTPAMRRRYNLADTVPRHTVQVYPLSWTAILVSLDNKGMWNLRSAIWPKRYLGQQLYMRVANDEKSLFTETDPPPNVLFCGAAQKV